ncbi:MAG: TIGR03067 domain-containing protein [Gemmatales bacterium]
MWMAMICLLIPVMDDNKKHPDFVAMQGEWGCTLNIRAGQRQPDETVETLFRDVKDDLVTISLFDKPLQKGKFTINPNVTPRQIDVTMLEGPAKDKISQGIYELKDGVFRICSSPPGNPRPTTFESKAGSNLSLTEWKLNKK